MKSSIKDKPEKPSIIKLRDFANTWEKLKIRQCKNIDRLNLEKLQVLSQNKTVNMDDDK